MIGDLLAVVGILITAYVRPTLVTSNAIGYLLAPLLITEDNGADVASVKQLLMRDLYHQAVSLSPTPMVLMPNDDQIDDLIAVIESAPDRRLTTGWRMLLKPEVFAEVARFYAHTEIRDRLRAADQHTLLYPSHLIPFGQLAHIPDFVREHEGLILRTYDAYANQTAKVLGRSAPVVWLMEPDWHQYNEATQRGGGLTQSRMVKLFVAMVAVFTSKALVRASTY